MAAAEIVPNFRHHSSQQLRLYIALGGSFIVKRLINWCPTLPGNCPVFWLVLLVLPVQAADLRDVTSEMGIESAWRLPLSGRNRPTERFVGRPLIFDMDSDGDQDLLLPAGPHWAEDEFRGANRLFRNDGMRFTEVTGQYRLDSLPPIAAATAGDVNRDGWLDLYLCHFGPDRLLINHNGQYFVDMTDSMGIDNPAWSTAAVMVDVNHDGWLDIYVANYIDYAAADTIVCRDGGSGEPGYCPPDLYDAVPNRLFVSAAGDTFVERSAEYGLSDTTSRSMTVLPMDANHDDRVDLFVLSYRSPNLLYIASADSGFSESGILAGAAFAPDGSLPEFSSATVGDVNHDFVDDIVLTCADGAVVVLINDGKGHFTDGHIQAGLGRSGEPYRAASVTLADVDYNGVTDLILAGGQPDFIPDTLLRQSPWQYPSLVLLRGQQTRALLQIDTLHSVADTTIMIPAAYTVIAEELSLELLYAQPAAADFSLESPPPPLPADSGAVDSASTQPAGPVNPRHFQYTRLDSLRVHEEAVQFYTVDFEGDGVPEWVAVYPSRSVRIYRQELRALPRFIGFTPSLGFGQNMLGYRVRIYADRVLKTDRLLTSSLPILTYFPRRVRTVQVELVSPAGEKSNYRASGLNQYFILGGVVPE